VKIHSPFKLKAMNDAEKETNQTVEKGELKQKFALLTDDYQLLDEGQHEQRMGRLELKLGKTKEEVHKLYQGI
jgi:uncharacterized protein YjbJ (UPF0337 family)